VNYAFHVQARQDYTDAIYYYLGIDAGLAEGFV
jgi:hypothetical protein